MKNTINNSNNIENEFKEYINNEIKNLQNQIKELNIKLNKKEDDIKNIINEKDMIIEQINNKLLEQEKTIIKNTY